MKKRPPPKNNICVQSIYLSFLFDNDQLNPVSVRRQGLPVPTWMTFPLLSYVYVVVAVVPGFEVSGAMEKSLAAQSAVAPLLTDGRIRRDPYARPLYFRRYSRNIDRLNPATTTSEVATSTSTAVGTTTPNIATSTPPVSLTCTMACTIADLYDTVDGHVAAGATVIGTQSWTNCNDGHGHTYEFKITPEYAALSASNAKMPRKSTADSYQIVQPISDPAVMDSAPIIPDTATATTTVTTATENAATIVDTTTSEIPPAPTDTDITTSSTTPSASASKDTSATNNRERSIGLHVISEHTGNGPLGTLPNAPSNR